MKKKKAVAATPSIKDELTQSIAYIYVIIMVGIHPIIYQNHFFGMVSAKTQLFWYTTAMFLVLMLVIQLFCLLPNGKKGKRKSIKELLSTWSITDWCIVVFFCTVIVSWLFSAYRSESFYGTPGWFVGVATLLSCCVAYYYISRYFSFSPSVIWIMLVVNMGVGTLAILNHFRVDPLGMFDNVRAEDWAIFISTIGNINLYSSYLCVIVPVFMALFCICQTRNSLLAYGSFLIIGFMNLIVVNSDSVFLGIGAAFVLLLWYAKDSWAIMKRYVSMVLLFLVSVQVMGGLHHIFETNAIVLSSIPNFFARSTYVLGAIFVAILMLAVVYRSEVKKADIRILKRVIWVMFGMGILLFIGMIVLVIWVNTSDAKNLSGWVQFLRFEDSWGSNRGFIWRYCIKLYQDFPIGHKLIGCGPDTLYYAMLDSYYTDMVQFLNAVFSNAHSEFLQLLVTLGLAGVVSYFAILVSSGIRYGKESKSKPLLIVIATVIVSYIGQGAVNNPQYITTPLLFVLLGVGEAIYRNEKKG